jgi:hypothetical protein
MTETELELARRHVLRGRIIIGRQIARVQSLKAAGRRQWNWKSRSVLRCGLWSVDFGLGMSASLQVDVSSDRRSGPSGRLLRNIGERAARTSTARVYLFSQSYCRHLWNGQQANTIYLVPIPPNPTTSHTALRCSC